MERTQECLRFREISSGPCPLTATRSDAFQTMQLSDDNKVRLLLLQHACICKG